MSLVVKGKSLGTVDFTAKLKGMRKEQDFCVCGIPKGDDQIIVQSDTRIGIFKPNENIILMSKSRSSGSYNIHLAMDVLKPLAITQSESDALKTAIMGSAGDLVGGDVMKVSNGGAVSVFDI